MRRLSKKPWSEMKLKEYLSVFFKHIYDKLQRPERLMVGALLVFFIGCILLTFALCNLSGGGEIFKTTASYGALILIIFWMLVLFGFTLTSLHSDNSSTEDESWIYDLYANRLMLLDIREHCKKSCTAEHCNNCALRKYREEK